MQRLLLWLGGLLAAFSLAGGVVAADLGPRRALLVNVNKPTWSYSFAARGAIPAGSTFTRASSRSCWDATRTLVTLGTNVPCFHVDPATGQSWGYLAEMQSTNAVTQSQDLTNAFWTALHVTASANAQTSPDGTANASTLLEDATTNRHELEMTGTVTTVASSVYGVSFFVKNVSGTRWVVLSPAGGTNYFGFQPSSGTLSSIAGTAFTNVSVRTLANGWFRIQAQYTAAATSTGLYLSMQTASPAAATQTYAGDGASSIAVWGVQFETAGVGVTSYIPTAGSTVTRSQDILSLPLTSLSGWNASKGGVMVAVTRRFSDTPSADNVSAGFNDGSSSNELTLRAGFVGADARFGAFLTAGNVSQFSISSSGTRAPLFVRSKSALGWSSTHALIAKDGVADTSSSGTYTLPSSFTALDLGRRFSSNLNGTLESIAYYAGARSDAFVQQVSR